MPVGALGRLRFSLSTLGAAFVTLIPILGNLPFPATVCESRRDTSIRSNQQHTLPTRVKLPIYRVCWKTRGGRVPTRKTLICFSRFGLEERPYGERSLISGSQLAFAC